MLHSALLKVTTKPQIFKSCGLAEPPGFCQESPHQAGGTLRLNLLSSLGTSLQERKGLLPTSHRTGSVQWLSPRWPVRACVSHTPPPEWLSCSQLSPPACTSSLKPLPQLFPPTTAGRQKTSRSDSQCWISSFLLLSLAPSLHYIPHPNTIPSLKCRPSSLTF